MCPLDCIFEICNEQFTKLASKESKLNSNAHKCFDKIVNFVDEENVFIFSLERIFLRWLVGTIDTLCP